MIERMKKVIVVSTMGKKRDTLVSLRKCGVMHVSDVVQKTTGVEDSEERCKGLEDVLALMKENGGKKVKTGASLPESDELFYSMLVSDLYEYRALSDRIQILSREIERVSPYGDFDVSEIEALAKDGYALTFYTLSGKELEKLNASEDGYYLIKSGKEAMVASINKKLNVSGLFEFSLPEKGLSALRTEKEEKAKRLESVLAEIMSYAPYSTKIRKELERLESIINFSRVENTVGSDGTFCFLTGYVPVSEVGRFESFAHENSWAYSMDDPSDEDNPPTRVVNKNVFRIVKPIFDILGTVPGYNERDISSYFLVFFTLFFAMIVGDAAYGCIFLLLAIYMSVKSKKSGKKISDANFLLYVLSVGTIVWGAITGTWFGSKAILEHSAFLRSLVIPAITNYPELFPGTDSEWVQNNVMQFCFIIGTVQLSLACVLNIKDKIGRKDLSWVADLGWLIDILVLYFLVLFLVIGADVSSMFPVIIGGVIVGYFLVLIFGAQGPGIPFKKGLISGLGGFFTTFLNTVSCFSNIMSYIRLFAVGMSSLAIAQSFNGMGGGMHGAMMIFGIVVIIFGHVLNLVMGLLSVVVHGVRLNLLEFSGQLGMEWSGYEYDPFRENGENQKLG